MLDVTTARRGDPDALRAARGAEAEVAGGNRDDAAEHEGLGETLNEIVRDVPHREAIGGDLVPHRSPVLRGRQPDDERRDDVASDNADEVVDHCQHRKHDQRGQHTRRDELLDRIRSEGVEGVDLLGHAHRSDLCGDS